MGRVTLVVIKDVALDPGCAESDLLNARISACMIRNFVYLQ
jgi:hypothetical protein